MENKVVFITGAASGIGAACALEYAKLGARLILTDIDHMDATRRQCLQAGVTDANICSVQGDLRKEEDIKRIVRTGTDKFDRVDILVNVAGITLSGGMDSPLSDLDTQYELLFRAIFSLCQKLTPYIIKQKGSIVNISSVNSKAPNIEIAPYSVIKSAVDHFSRCLALELAPHGVRVNTINPGVIESPIHWSYAGFESREEFDREKCDEYFNTLVSKWNALPYNGLPEQVAAYVIFVTSDKAKFITGDNLLMDGGWLLKTGQTGH